MLDFTLENISAEEVERLRAVYEPLAQSVRELIDATVRTQVDVAAVAAAKAEIDSATARLRRKQLDGAFGVRYLASGERLAWGNVAIGIRNPIAPPLAIQHDGSGKAWCDFHLGAGYEGPPGHVHGGVAAWFSITCWARPPVMGSIRVSPGRSPSATCGPPDSGSCTPKRRPLASTG